VKHFTIGRIGLALLATGVICLSLAAVASARAPALSWSSSSGSFDYGTVQAGQTPSLTFTLTNTGDSGTGALTVSLPSPSPFSITSDTCTRTSLGPRKSCTVTVQYTPATSSDSAVLTASSKKASASATLTGSKQSEPQSQIDCQSFGGAYTTGPPGRLWKCAGYTDSSSNGPNGKTLETDCGNEGGIAWTIRPESATSFDGFCLGNPASTALSS
jgi:centrosomal CEP192-like protein